MYVYFCLICAIYEIYFFLSVGFVTNIEKTVTPLRLTADEAVHVHIVVQLQTSFTVVWLTIHEPSPTLENNEDNPGHQTRILLWKRIVRLDYIVDHLPRGVYSVGEIAVEFGDLLGLFRVKRTYSQRFRNEKMVVYPRIAPVQGWNNQHDGTRRDVRRPVKKMEESSDTMGVREYREGDRLNRIHWPSSAKRGVWVSKEFEQYEEPKLAFIPDLSITSYGSANPLVFETAMSVTASLLRHTAKLGHPFELLVADSSSRTGSIPRRYRSLNASMEVLAGLQPSAKADFPAVLDQLGPIANAQTYVVVTPRLDEPMRRPLRRLQGIGNVHLFVLRKTSSFADDTQSDEVQSEVQSIVDTLLGTGVAVHWIQDLEQLSRLGQGRIARAPQSSI
ncbi:DUF58 domain-containing protein [Alicyclobacillus acidiphilus]|uniref:DUF58 domain-containing protein n=1 Tax=Alicyclobacillus acidiphilus TaxID=182455 RepID=UPI00082EE133|nr:DUF58 domain-containing protein [Alicyclobacillus acidiphilus]